LFCNALTVINKVNNSDGGGVDTDISHKERQRALSNATTTKNENATGGMEGR
jgi:hypothetical protein